MNVMSDSSTGVTQQISELTINDDIYRFLISIGTILFYPDWKNNLYKVSILEHDLIRSKLRFLQWGSNCDEWVCSKSIWAYSQLTQLLSTVKKIPKDLSAHINGLVQSATLGSGSPDPVTIQANYQIWKLFAVQIFQRSAISPKSFVCHDPGLLRQS